MDVRPDQVVYYTDKMLTENFISIDQGLRALSNAVSHLEGHVVELSKAPKVIVKAKGGKFLPFVAGAVVGIYVYRKFQGSTWKVEVGNPGKRGKAADYTIKVPDPDAEKTENDTDKQSPSA